METAMKGERLFIEKSAELAQHLTEEKNMNVRFKLAFLECFSKFGHDLEAICQAFGIAVPTGYFWIKIWNTKGYSGLAEEHPRTGRSPKLDEWDISFLTLLLKKQSTWTTDEVQELIRQHFGVSLSLQQVSRILRDRVGMHYSKPFPHDYRRPAEAEAMLKARLGQVFTELKDKGIHQSEIAIGFMDETSPQNRANTVKVWSFAEGPIELKNTTHFKSNTIGFYAIQGISLQGFLENSSEEAIADFLKKVKEANVSAKAIVIVLDNYSSHASAKVREIAQTLDIYFVYLPPYSPDLNPIEFIWKSIKRLLSKELILALDEMKKKIAEGWKELSLSPSFARKWIAEFLDGQKYYMDLC